MWVWGVIGVAAALLLALWLAAGWVFYRMTLSRRVGDRFRRERLEAPQTDDGRALLAWEDALTPRPERVSVSPDGKLTLTGLLYARPQSKNRWVIAVHGHGHGKEFMRYAAYYLYERGLNVLAIDLRAHGDSGGRGVTMGWADRTDIALWARYIEGRCPGCAIALYGISLGAATVTMASGEALPPCVKAVVADSPFADVQSLFRHACKNMFRLPAALILPSYALSARLFAGLRIGDASPLKQIEKGGNLPILFIHGTGDKLIPHAMSETLCAAAGARARLHLVPGAEHGCGCVVDPGYWDLVTTFLTEAFDPTPAAR